MFGILGGTFDPPHIGHLALANAAIEQLRIDEVRLVPAGVPWQKADRPVTDAHHRLAMTRLAAAEDPRFVVSDIEIERQGPSYTIDTVKTMGEGGILILGSDAAFGISTWERAEDLLDIVDLAVVERPGVSHGQVEDRLGRSVHRLTMPSIELSGTEIREHVEAGWSPRFQVPGAVGDYIIANGLYR